ncbi:MAG TPA: EAL domain-containing protein, partial [Acidimicrobiales bacterium]|nr:EAL domain-containing protein [Acidimicrobiales bacterium]
TGKPVVLLSHRVEGMALPTVCPDNRLGTREAVSHLIAHGHERVAFVGNVAQYDLRQRFLGYQDALREVGIEPDPELFFAVDNNHEGGGRDAGARLLANRRGCTALLAATDYTAMGVMQVMAEGGVPVPGDLAVVGFDDMPRAAVVSPSLTTVNQNFDAIGSEAVALVERMLAGVAVPAGEHEVATSLVLRESCGCIEVALPKTAPGTDMPPVQSFVHNALALVSGAPQPRAGNRQGRPLSATMLPQPATRPRPQVQQVAAAMAAVFADALRSAPGPAQLLALEQMAQQFYDACPGPSVFGLLTLAQRLARELGRGMGAQAPAKTLETLAERLDACVQQIGVGLSRAALLEQVELNNTFRNAVWNQYDISLDLLRSHEYDPRSLAWMRRTLIRMAVLALWEGDGGVGGRQLEMSGLYDAEPPERPTEQEPLTFTAWQPPGTFPLAQFPPVALLDLAASGPQGTLALVLPVRTAASDWGFLGLVVPPGTIVSDQESYFQWSALLSQALDYEAVTASVRRTNAELAESFRREQEMAAIVRRSEERYALASRAVNDGLWDWDVATGTVYYSARWKQLFGYGPQEIGDAPGEWLDRAHPEDREGLVSVIDGHLRGEFSGSFEVEHRVRAADGSYRWALCRGLSIPEEGPVSRLVGSLSDITERKSLEERLAHQALYDALTGLPNRVLFLERLSQAIATWTDSEAPSASDGRAPSQSAELGQHEPAYHYAVLWLDLDGFKVINDSLGHLAGDKLLVEVAHRISSQLRAGDMAARFGGDEFAVLLSDLNDLIVVDGIVARLQERLSEPFEVSGQAVVITASIGIATSSSGYRGSEEVLRDADIAMYEAKSGGRAGAKTFEQSMYLGAMSRMHTETALRHAIDNDELELHYQPIVMLEDGRLHGVEVLVRWRHPQRGLAGPGEFLPVAEESGLIIPLGRWVQYQTCAQLSRWKAAGIVPDQLRASINVSHREFWSPRFLDQLDEVLAATGASAHWLTIEITEGVVMQDIDKALGVLGELRARQAHIHIDDFGTGYSSLGAVHTLPVDGLKIDKSFVARLEDEGAAELVRAILQFGRKLGVDVIAEGIETPQQQLRLRELGCQLGQGYWFCVPVPAGRFKKALAKHPVAAVTPPAGHASSARPGPVTGVVTTSRS